MSHSVKRAISNTKSPPKLTNHSFSLKPTSWCTLCLKWWLPFHSSKKAMTNKTKRLVFRIYGLISKENVRSADHSKAESVTIGKLSNPKNATNKKMIIHFSQEEYDDRCWPIRWPSECADMSVSQSKDKYPFLPIWNLASSSSRSLVLFQHDHEPGHCVALGAHCHYQTIKT